MSVTVAEIVRTLERSFPAQWAEPWDAVGLLSGFAESEVDRVLVTLDPTMEVLERAAAAGVGAVVSHHPAFLKTPERLTQGEAVAVRALEARVALIAAHTNLDRAPEGADALSAALGFRILGPLERGMQPVDLIVTYVPAPEAERVMSAMTAAGGGRIGLYEGCAYTSDGTGTFVPLAGSDPAVGAPGRRASAAEVRVEMVAPRGCGPAVVSAAVGAHPYDEPVVLLSESSIARGAARLGRLCDVGGRSLREIADDIACRLQVTPRVLGDPDVLVQTIAVANGSAGSLLSDALSTGAQAFLVGELRYHDALEAASSGLAVIEIGHDASEWPMVSVLARAVRETEGLSPEDVDVDEAGTLYWTP